MAEVLSDIEQRVLAKLFEGLPRREMGPALHLSDTNVRFGITKLMWRYKVETVDELLEKVRREREGK